MEVNSPRSAMVSVIIPAFRNADFVNQALKSIRNQTYPNIEITIVDDGSGDEFVNRYELDDRTKLCRHEESLGPAAARNTGIRESRGKFLAFMDMDDVWLPDKLQTQVELLENDPRAGLTFCHHTLVDQDLKPLARQPKPKETGSNAFTRLLAGNIIKSCSVVMVSREAILKCGDFDVTLSGTDDWDMWLRIARDYAVYADPVPRVLYRVHPYQLSKSAFVMRRADVMIMEKWLEWARRHNPQITGLLRRRLSHKLQRLAKVEAREGNMRTAMRMLCQAVAASPWDIRCYLRPLTLVCLGGQSYFFGNNSPKQTFRVPASQD